MKIACQRHLFDIPDSVAWFNTAYMGPLLRSAMAAGIAGLTRKERPWQISAADFFEGPEAARAAFAALVGASADDIAIVPSASYGLGTAAAILPLAQGQTVLVMEGEFPSQYYPWAARAAAVGASILTVPAPVDGDWTGAVLRRLDRSVATAALSHCHWADGGLLDLETIAAACRSQGTALALDLTQSAGVVPISVAAVQPDFLVAATYKWLLGPYGLGFMYVAPQWHDARPLEGGWASRAGAEDFAGLANYTNEFQPGARRFDVGERSNFALLPVAMAALAQIAEWTPEGIAATLADVTAGLAERLAGIGLTAGAAHLRSPHLLGLRLPEGVPDTLSERLAARQIYTSRRGGMLRIAPHLHVNAADCDRLVEALTQVLRTA
jgi:selenocysteine lyase/cysteine desulfurase